MPAVSRHSRRKRDTKAVSKYKDVISRLQRSTQSAQANLIPLKSDQTRTMSNQNVNLSGELANFGDIKMKSDALALDKFRSNRTNLPLSLSDSQHEINSQIMIFADTLRALGSKISLQLS